MGAKWDPKGNTFIVTGGASGLGTLFTKRFLEEGAKYIAILDISEDKGQELTEKLNSTYPGKVFFYKCDVGDEAQLTEVFANVVNKFGQVDAIINNAGIMNDSSALWSKATDVNYRGLVSLTLKGVKHMRKDEGGAGGTVINVSSIAAFVRGPFLPIYSGAKAAVLHFSLSIAMDPFYEKTGVRVMALCPSATNTPLLQNLQDRPWDDRDKTDLVDFAATSMQMQKPESAANAMVQIFKEGENGSAWVTMSDKPAKDITSNIDAALKSLESLIE